MNIYVPAAVMLRKGWARGAALACRGREWRCSGSRAPPLQHQPPPPHPPRHPLAACGKELDFSHLDTQEMTQPSRLMSAMWHVIRAYKTHSKPMDKATNETTMLSKT